MNIPVIALQSARNEYDKLAKMARKDMIQDDTLKQQSDEPRQEIEKLEQAVAETSERAKKWGTGMAKTINTIAHVRECFNTGSIEDRHDGLLGLGSTPEIIDGKLSLTAYDWLIPVKKAYKSVEAELLEIQPQLSQMSEIEATQVMEGIKNKRLAIRFSVKTILVSSSEATLYAC